MINEEINDVRREAEELKPGTFSVRMNGCTGRMLMQLRALGLQARAGRTRSSRRPCSL